MTNTARIVHVLFLDIVGYSRQATSVQHRLLERLNATVQFAPAYADALHNGTAQPLPTGDGMALVYFADVTAPARCAIEIARALTGDPLPLRMGLHSGLV
jgi:hypothetical protein